MVGHVNLNTFPFGVYSYPDWDIPTNILVKCGKSKKYKQTTMWTLLARGQRCSHNTPSHHSHSSSVPCLKFFSHIARADPFTDHSRALRACVAPFQGTGTGDWADRVTPGSIRLSTTQHWSGIGNRLSSSAVWSMLVGTATSSTVQARRW